MTPRLAAALLATLLAGCAALEQPASPLPRLSAVPRSFEMSGRLAVRQGERSDIARLRWTRHGSTDEWVVSSPLGNEVARIESTPSGASLAQAGGPSEEAPSFQALTGKVLGVALDPAWLAQGLHGKIPEDLPPGWHFSLDEKQDSGAVQLARRITVSHGDTTVRLVVDSYQPLPD